MSRSVTSALRAGAACALALGLFSAVAPPAAAAPTTLKEAAQAKGRYFGGIMSSNSLNNPTATSLAAREFGVITPENEMKWDTSEPSPGNFNYGPGDRIQEWAAGKGMKVRGHTLVWYNPDVESQLPAWVKQLPLQQVRGAMENHVTQLVKHYKGKLLAWDVVNEPFNDDGSYRNSVFYQAMGKDYIAIALRAARAADPDVKLYLNDYNTEGDNSPKSNAMYNLAKQLKADGVPLDGIGLESHFEVGTVPSTIQSNMQRLTGLGLDVAVTEYDNRMQVKEKQNQTPVNPGDLNTQATETKNLVTACLNVARCVGMSQWAVGDADNWVPLFFPGSWGSATLFDVNYQPKPAYYAALNAFGGGSGGGQGSTSLGAYVWLVGAKSGRCLDVPAGGDGTQLQLWDCTGSSSQSFLLHADGSVRGGGKCLDAPNGAAPGWNLQVWSCSGAANQKWTLTTDGNLRSNSSGLCADPWGGATGNGTKLVLWNCYVGANQQWSFSSRPLIGDNSGRCLDVPLNGANGSLGQLWDCWASPNQTFTLTYDGSLRVQGKCLDFPTGGAPGTNLQIWDCGGTANQKWTLTSAGTIVNLASGLCLDTSYGATGNGARAILWTCHGGASQKWHM
ncbi:endo-1,4-beta-xylanase [Kitasatospora gansuensis]|uniref:Beta-xylanase n=1 Tax=Kitasatospora gansuensis TaxID=258050 RepID=A0A7W7WL77_9ACTN|nr:endo-1,4-beta-xylanase [Kitasatospora gansuensis]MBB4951537.1 endo-1,4-beta-xylanase [Kitasatospora gansuensis]